MSQELWILLASAAATNSGIPQRLLDEKAEELRKKKELEEQINVSILFLIHGSTAIQPFTILEALSIDMITALCPGSSLQSCSTLPAVIGEHLGKGRLLKQLLSAT